MQYELPKEERGKEKIIGGVLELGQAAWILMGILIGGGFALLTYKAIGGFALFIGIIFAPIGLPFAFVKIKGFSLVGYFFQKRKFDQKEKILIKKRVL